jgi:hypothetical protein
MKKNDSPISKCHSCDGRVGVLCLQGEWGLDVRARPHERENKCCHIRGDSKEETSGERGKERKERKGDTVESTGIGSKSIPLLTPCHTKQKRIQYRIYSEENKIIQKRNYTE